jgi:hypothetical protein
MIRYALVCEHEHLFEAWFRSSADYDDQATKGLVECPACLSTSVGKQVMSPAIAGTKRNATNEMTPAAQAQMRSVMMETMGKVRRHVEDNFDYVGDTFAREARDIHDGVSEQRGIYGEASPSEVKALVADGIQVAPLPPAPTPKPKSQLN